MPQSGILKTRVFTSRGQLPVEDAAVSIVQHGQNVQIFSGVTSIQDLPLIPLAEATGRPASRVDITPQNL